MLQTANGQNLKDFIVTRNNFAQNKQQVGPEDVRYKMFLHSQHISEVLSKTCVKEELVKTSPNGNHNLTQPISNATSWTIGRKNFSKKCSILTIELIPG